MLLFKCPSLENAFATSRLNSFECTFWVLKYDDGLAESLMLVIDINSAKLNLSERSVNAVNFQRDNLFRDLCHVDDLLTDALVLGMSDLLSVSKAVTPLTATFKHFKVAQFLAGQLQLSLIIEEDASFKHAFLLLDQKRWLGQIIYPSLHEDDLKKSILGCICG